MDGQYRPSEEEGAVRGSVGLFAEAGTRPTRRAYESRGAAGFGRFEFTVRDAGRPAELVEGDVADADIPAAGYIAQDRAATVGASSRSVERQYDFEHRSIRFRFNRPARQHVGLGSHDVSDIVTGDLHDHRALVAGVDQKSHAVTTVFRQRVDSVQQRIHSEEHALLTSRCALDPAERAARFDVEHARGGMFL
jgi:hypothetical protein